jgi:sigma-B regulation protein RsbU (phosphoserine phosphatase)
MFDVGRSMFDVRLFLPTTGRIGLMPNERLRCMEVFGGSEPVSRCVPLGGLDAWVESVPYSQSAAGGDVYYVSTCATGRITRLLLADVSGHGVRVAEVARMLRGLMRVHVNHLDQRRFVQRMNDAFAAVSTGGLFATAVICTYFAPTRSMALCNAGHPPPMFFRAAEGRWRPLENDPDAPDAGGPVRNLPLGILPDVAFEQFTVTLGPRDLVLAYSDALIEAIDADGEPLGVNGLCDVLNELKDPAGETLVPRLLAALRARTGTTLDADDVTALLFSPNPESERPQSIPARLAVPFVWLRRTINWRADGTRRLPWPDLRLANIGGALVPALGRLWRH